MSKKINSEHWRINSTGATRIRLTIVTHVFVRVRGGWQLPCGCLGPDIYTSNDAGEAYCSDCHRGWKHMTTHCAMLDGGKQGPPVLVLTKEMIHASPD